MAPKAQAPVDLYIAAYGDADAAQRDWDGIKQLANDNVIDVDGLMLVSRDSRGKIDVKDNAHDVRKGATIGAVAGTVVGLIFPPSILGSAVLGAAAGGGIGGLRDRRKKREIKEDVEKVLPPNSSGIVVLFEERWMDQVESALGDADTLTKHEVDAESADSVKSAAGGD
jgi:uncharacterized membrane protein